MVADVLNDLLGEVIELAEQAGALTLAHFRQRHLVVEGKVDGTAVTVADRGAEQLIRDHLARHHGADGVLGEEFGAVEGTSARRWIVDPIDGTHGFVRGVPLYATLIAAVDADGPELGVIHLPALGRTVAAARGEGCWCDGARCHVGGRDRLDGALVCTSDWNATDDATFARLRAAGANLRTWGDAYGYAMVACGEAEAMVDPVCAAWDLAPMPVIIGEAGGRFTGLDGRPGFDHGHGLATNGAVHDDLVAVYGTHGG